jgi:alpha-ketoglutarate-dependent 2,4-dichlorophenoxyacetate dioxygenase
MVTTRLTPHFAAQVDGVDITRPLDEPAWKEVRAALDEHSVLVFRGQALDDDTQTAFSRRFGSLEVTRSMNPAAGTPFARQSNLDIKTGEVIPPDDRRMVYQLANMLWHTDSSFKEVPSLCSLLSARIIPPAGGATEFASTRCAYPSLPDTLKRQVETSSPRRSAPSTRRCATPSSARTQRTGTRTSSWARTPPTSWACRWRRAARS